MTQTVAAAQLRAFVERIERIEADIKEMNADKSEVYKELRGVGFDVKAVRQCVVARKLDSSELDERNAVFDMYWDALTGASHVHVHEEQPVTATKQRVHVPSQHEPEGAGADDADRQATVRHAGVTGRRDGHSTPSQTGVQ